MGRLSKQKKPERPTERPRDDQETTTNKNGKNGKNGKKKNIGGEKIDFPENLKNPEFEKAWGEWEVFRQEIKKKLTESMKTKQLNMLSKFGTETAQKMIEQSIMNGWQGLFELKVGQITGGGLRKSPAQQALDELNRMEAMQ